LYCSVTLGAITGLTSSIIGSLFPLPRVLYSMASDGLLFSIFSQISSQSRTPVYSTLIGGIIAAFMALIFDLLTLVEMLSIGTLIAYTQVALAVLISRYENSDSNLSGTLFSILIMIVCLCLISIHEFEQQHDYINPLIFIVFSCLICLLIHFVYKKFSKRKENLDNELGKIFLTPYVPWLPVLSIFCNIYLMLKLRFITWIRFLIWMIIGLSIYLFYGIHQAGRMIIS